MNRVKSTFLAVICSVFSIAIGYGQEDISAIETEEETAKPAPRQTGGNLFEPKRTAWAISLHGGYPMVRGDEPSDMGLSYGLDIRKTLGHSISIRAIGIAGYATGQGFQRRGAGTLVNNNAYNGVNNPNSNYAAAGRGVFHNYRNDFVFANMQLVFNLNNINFMRQFPRSNFYVFAGGGALLSMVSVDALDANGQMYDYTDISSPTSPEQRRDVINRIKAMRDGTYETAGDESTNDQKVGDYRMIPSASFGLGYSYKISERFGLGIEGTYVYTNDDLLDGMRWLTGNVTTSSNDAFLNFSLSLQIRLGRTSNVYWYTNPLSTPFTTIAENKRKLQKVDALERKVDDLASRQDSADAINALLTADSDNDGVSDYFDREDNTPEGAIVDGAGRTLFYTDEDGNLVMVDPDAAEAARRAATGGTDGRPAGTTRTNAAGQPVTTFDHKAQAGKTVVTPAAQRGQSGASGMPGTSTAMGFMPAIFFESDQSFVRQQYYPELFMIAQQLKKNPNMKLYVIGYTDSRASEAYNKALGKRRAQAVADALVNYFGVNRAQLVVESRGQAEPLTNLKSMPAMAANRRVQFSTSPSGTGGGSSAQPAQQQPPQQKQTTPARPQQQQAAPPAQQTPPPPPPIEDIDTDF